MKIHFWAPNIFEFKGGIQTFSKFLLKAFLADSSEKEIEVFLKHDTSRPSEEKFSAITFNCFGKYPKGLRTLFFSIGLILHAIKDRPDLIIMTHVNFSPAAYLLQKVLKIPYWVVVHGTEVWGMSSESRKQALASADKVLSVSSFTKEVIAFEQGIEESRITIFPNTFDEERFQISDKPLDIYQGFDIPVESKLILTVARLDPGHRSKGYDVILDALPDILNEVPEAHYILVGKGADRKRIEEKILRYNLSTKVTLAGFISDEELPDYYSACDIYAMPSQGEGFGIVYLEAMASGKPVLAGNIDGSVDPLVHGQLGLLVDPRSRQEVAQGIIKLLTKQAGPISDFSPEALRSEVVQRFGFEAFKSNLSNCLRSFRI